MDDSLSTLLAAARSGDDDAARRVFALLYDDLHRCAHRQLRNDRSTLSTTSLVHETYLKTGDIARMQIEDRRHFMAISARAMRQVLVDHARRGSADKRGGQAVMVTLNEHIEEPASEALEVLALDRALSVLEQIDERAARVVQLHFFAGMSFPAIAELENLNERTVKRDWQAARALLAAEMRTDRD